MAQSPLSSMSEPDSSRTESSEGSKYMTNDEATPVEDSGLSPVDMECHIQAERIAKSLDKLVYQAKLALCVSTLLKKGILDEILSEQHLSDINYIYQQYENPLFSASLLNMAAIEDMQAGDMSLKHRINPELGFLMYTLHSYEELKPHVEVIFYNLKKEFSGRKNTPQRRPRGLSFVLKLEEFRNLMVVQMENTARDELAAKIRTRKLEKSNQEELAEIAEFSKSMTEENETFEKDMSKKSEMIAQLKQEIETFKHRDWAKRKKQILDSERQMVLASRVHKVKYQMLVEEEAETTENYEASLRDHLLSEKNLRLRRIKVETQLQSWLQKYDSEMSVKQEELDELTKMYDDELEQKEKLEKDLEEQNKEFDPLMEEREKEYHAEMEEKFKQCLIDHAARVIQVAWRDTLANRAEKKKLKKLQKKQEAERELAERKAELEAKKAAAAAKREAAAIKKAEKEAAQQAKLEAAAAKAAAAAAENEK